MEVSVPGSGFCEDGMSVASLEVVAGAKLQSTTLDSTDFLTTQPLTGFSEISKKVFLFHSVDTSEGSATLKC